MRSCMYVVVLMEMIANEDSSAAGSLFSFTKEDTGILDEVGRLVYMHSYIQCMYVCMYACRMTRMKTTPPSWMCSGWRRLSSTRWPWRFLPNTSPTPLSVSLGRCNTYIHTCIHTFKHAIHTCIHTNAYELFRHFY
jgi:hypothetical protein